MAIFSHDRGQQMALSGSISSFSEAEVTTRQKLLALDLLLRSIEYPREHNINNGILKAAADKSIQMLNRGAPPTVDTVQGVLEELTNAISKYTVLVKKKCFEVLESKHHIRKKMISLLMEWEQWRSMSIRSCVFFSIVGNIFIPFLL